jgi:hypothetical protein
MSAQRIKERLDQLQILEQLKSSYPNYDLLCTGMIDSYRRHSFVFNIIFLFSCQGISLGAGLAALVSMLLKKDNPTLKCIAFSPPGKKNELFSF